jgi:hypothetical protein
MVPHNAPSLIVDAFALVILVVEVNAVRACVRACVLACVHHLKLFNFFQALNLRWITSQKDLNQWKLSKMLKAELQ